MYQTTKTYIRSGMMMAELIDDNPYLLLMLQHFEIDYVARDKTVRQVCETHAIHPLLFMRIGNLYNGFRPEPDQHCTTQDIEALLRFLSNSHVYYKHDKYPEIRSYISQLYQYSHQEEVKLIEAFFDDYFNEVLEHLNYEEQVVFPYFSSLAGMGRQAAFTTMRASEYAEHHSDIETKLSDLKNLLLHHLPVRKEYTIRRKLIFSLLELEYDLKIHSEIEEHILMPLATSLEGEGV